MKSPKNSPIFENSPVWKIAYFWKFPKNRLNWRINMDKKKMRQFFKIRKLFWQKNDRFYQILAKNWLIFGHSTDSIFTPFFWNWSSISTKKFKIDQIFNLLKFGQHSVVNKTQISELQNIDFNFVQNLHFFR